MNHAALPRRRCDITKTSAPITEIEWPHMLQSGRQNGSYTIHTWLCAPPATVARAVLELPVDETGCYAAKIESSL